jgi:L-malate glycosyltransferase
MNALLLTPTFAPSLTGNAVTVERIGRALAQGGVVCRILDLSRPAPAVPPDRAGRFEPDIIHVFHAFKAGPVGLKIKKTLHVPMITTMTGTDINLDIRTPGRKEIILEVLHRSDRITVFNEHAKALLVRRRIPPERIAVIHQAVRLPASGALDYRAMLQIDRDAPAFLLLGAVRAVKNYPYAIQVLEKVEKSYPGIRLIIAGPVLEEEAYAQIRKRIAGITWITWLGEVSRENVPSLFAAVDIVLNTSSSESESNTVLEALSLGKIVIGRAIPGNASILTEQTGFTFHNKNELFEKIMHALTHRDQWEAMQRQARQWIGRQFHPDRERSDYLAVYQQLMSASDRKNNWL